MRTWVGTLCLRALLATMSTVGIACGEAADPCQRQTRCVRDETGHPSCLPGYRWRTPDNLHDYSCVLDVTPDAGWFDAVQTDAAQTDAAQADAAQSDVVQADAGSADASCAQAGWTFEQIPVPDATVHALDMVLDASNRPHLVCLLDRRNDGWQSLWYATHDGTQWQTAELAAVANTFGPPQIAVDRLGLVHVGYTRIELAELQRRLIYSHNGAGHWSRQVVPTDGLVGFHCDLVADSFNRPHFSYVAGVSSAPDELRHIYRSGFNWTDEVTEISDGSSLHENIIRLDASGNPHVVFRADPGCAAACATVAALRIAVRPAVGHRRIRGA